MACENESIEELADETSISEDMTAKKGAKIDVCHKGKIINVSVNSLKGHQGHGDAIDMDGDGYFDIENSCSEIDCDDADAAVNPEAAEEAYDGIDNDCNPETLDDDLDQDGFNLVDDCDDTNAAVNPGAEEICDNGIDDNCDGNIDEDCIPNIGDCKYGGIVIYIAPQPTDLDGDGDLDNGLVVTKEDLLATNFSFNYPESIRLTLAGISATAIGTGQANTTAWMNQPGYTGGVATVCDDYSIIDEGVTYDDWFLPSLDELNQIYINKATVNAACGGNNLGNKHWSSTEERNYAVYIQIFNTGVATYEGKGAGGPRIRAVRAF